MWICRSGKLRKIIHNILNSLCEAGVILLVVCFFSSDIWSLQLRGSGFCWVGPQKGKACKRFESASGWWVQSLFFFFLPFHLCLILIEGTMSESGEFYDVTILLLQGSRRKKKKLEIKHFYKMENHYLICILYNSAWRTLKLRVESILCKIVVLRLSFMPSAFLFMPLFFFMDLLHLQVRYTNSMW